MNPPRVRSVVLLSISFAWMACTAQKAGDSPGSGGGAGAGQADGSSADTGGIVGGSGGGTGGGGTAGGFGGQTGGVADGGTAGESGGFMVTDAGQCLNPEAPQPGGGCPATRAELDVPSLLQACCADSRVQPIGYCPFLFQCGHLTAISLGSSNGLGGGTCYYDSTTGALATVEFCTDSRVLCGGKSYCEYTGVEVPPCADTDRTFKFSACK